MSLDQSGLDKLVKRLRKLSRADSASSLNEKKAERCLVQLQSMRLPVEQLERTGLATIVNRLRKLLRSESALKTARRLIKDWRLVVEQAAGDQKSDRDRGDGHRSDAGKEVNKPPERAATSAAEAKAMSPLEAKVKPPVESVDTAEDAASATSDPMRIKCREMLQQALEQPASASDEAGTAAGSRQPRRLAVEIESAVFAEFSRQATTDATRYKTRIRSLLMNLRDPKNPGLRHCLLRGDLTSDQVARMRPDQLASEEMKQLREKLVKDAVRVHQAAAQAAAEPGSSLFTCKRCRKKNCTYNQLQTLPGDEPMTTYVVCNECGFRWKFN